MCLFSLNDFAEGSSQCMGAILFILIIEDNILLEQKVQQWQNIEEYHNEYLEIKGIASNLSQQYFEQLWACLQSQRNIVLLYLKFYKQSLIVQKLQDIIMANQFSSDQIKQIQQSFKLFDKDNDGFLSRNEVAALIREMACISSESQINKLISEIDGNGNGQIEESQFISLMAKMMLTITSQKDMLESFKVFDVRSEKGITFEGLKQILLKMGQKMSDEDILNMIKQADEDGDGKVSFEQFKKLMQR